MTATDKNSSTKKVVLTANQKKILNISITVLQVAIIIIAITFSIIILVNPSRHKIPKSGTFFMPVLSDSMNGENKDSFKAGDLVVAHAPVVGHKKWDPHKLKKGDIVTYIGEVNGKKEPITHRIDEVINQAEVSASSPIAYRTKGDKNLYQDTVILYPDKIVGIYKYHTPGAGKFIVFLQKPTNFILVVILPLLALFVYNVVLFVMMLMERKQTKLATENISLSKEQEEERKQQIIAEYLAKQNQPDEKINTEITADSEISDNTPEDETESSEPDITENNDKE